MVTNLQYITETTSVFLKAFATRILPFTLQTLAPQRGRLLFSPVLLAGRVRHVAQRRRRRCKWIRVQLRYFSDRGCAGNVAAVAEKTRACGFRR